jgi:hypothetical protein
MGLGPQPVLIPGRLLLIRWPSESSGRRPSPTVPYSATQWSLGSSIRACISHCLVRVNVVGIAIVVDPSGHVTLSGL